jgi:hemoglobin
MSVVIGCENTKTPAPPKPLYERLGGTDAIRKVVDDFVARAAADDKVNFTRKGIPGAEWDPSPTNMERFKKSLTEFIADKSGGPVKYTGRDMLTAHKGMRITNTEFDALAGHLKAALVANRVPQDAQNDLMALVETTRKQMVEVRN